jgi:hypothetical protein
MLAVADMDWIFLVRIWNILHEEEITTAFGDSGN